MFCGAASTGETLYNGIELPDTWPPNYGELTREPMRIPYLEEPPEVINIDVGRQLFVDDFLIEELSLMRTFHHPEYYEGNPVLKPDSEWENHGPSPFAGPFSGGVWYDAKDKLFNMWYVGGYIKYSCYATSRDGIHWEKPKLDVVSGTNIVVDHGSNLGVVREDRPRMESEQRPLDTTSAWIDYRGTDHARRYKLFYTSWFMDNPDDWCVYYKYSADGVHWSEEPAANSGHVGDHTNVHYNPFRDKWVVNVRFTDEEVGRSRGYVEHDDPAKAIRLAGLDEDEQPTNNVVPWLSADYLDPHNPNAHRAKIEPQLYHFDAIAYESLMLGQFSIWQGPTNEECGTKKIQKRNEVVFGYSRDGFHFDRPERRPVFYATEEEGAWNWGNVQSAGSACIPVEDKLYLYFTSRGLPGDRFWDGYVNTGLAFLRRDGFASLSSVREEGSVLTRPVQFSGKYLYVNADRSRGSLRVEIANEQGDVIEPFTENNCIPFTSDKTLHRITWEGIEDLSSLSGTLVRFRFILGLGKLYSFWVSPSETGASYGYVGAGGPGYTSFLDTLGNGAYGAS